MDDSQPKTLSFHDPCIEGYAALILEMRSHGTGVIEAIQQFRERFPESTLTFPDIGSAYGDADPRRILERCLGLRQRERMNKAVEKQRREAVSNAKRPIRRAILKESREARRQIEDELHQALNRAINDEGHWRGAEAYLHTIDRLARRISPVAQGCMDLGETLGYAQDLDDRFLNGTAEIDDLFVRDGGGYALYSPIDGSSGLHLRREQWSRVIASDAVLLAWNLRYRGAGRKNETKGLSGEEGRRRGIAQRITGRRDGINTRSMRDMAQNVMPWLSERYAERATALAVCRGIPKGDVPAFVRNLADAFPEERLVLKAGIAGEKLKAARPGSSTSECPVKTVPFSNFYRSRTGEAVQQVLFA
jgi:hypothetical protein